MNIDMDSGTLSVEFIESQGRTSIAPEVTLIAGDPELARIAVDEQYNVTMRLNKPKSFIGRVDHQQHYLVRIPTDKAHHVLLHAGQVKLKADNVQQHFSQIQCDVTVGGIRSILALDNNERRFLVGQRSEIYGTALDCFLKVQVKVGEISIS